MLGPHTSANPDHELAFLRWAATRDFGKPEVRMIELPERTLSRVTVTHAASTGKPIIGCGRDVNLSSALSRAYGEACERLVAQDVYDAEMPLVGSRIRVAGEDIEVSAAEETFALPPPGLRTSNGWAVHFDFATAVRGAVAEVLERHILLYAFFSRGWAGFRAAGETELLGKRIQLLDAGVTCAGYRAGLAMARLERHAGFTAGFTSAPIAAREEFWLQAVLEAAEPAVALDRQSPAEVEALARSADPLEHAQAHYAREARPAPGVARTLDLGADIELRLASFDLGRKWNLPFPFHAAFVTGESTLPLLFKSTVDACPQSRAQVDRLLAHHGLELPDVHPII